MLVMVQNRSGQASNGQIGISSVSLPGIARLETENRWPGDKVAITFPPDEDGSRAGSYMAIKLPNGKEWAMLASWYRGGMMPGLSGCERITRLVFSFGRAGCGFGSDGPRFFSAADAAANADLGRHQR